MRSCACGAPARRSVDGRSGAVDAFRTHRASARGSGHRWATGAKAAGMRFARKRQLTGRCRRAGRRGRCGEYGHPQRGDRQRRQQRAVLAVRVAVMRGCGRRRVVRRRAGRRMRCLMRCVRGTMWGSMRGSGGIVIGVRRMRTRSVHVVSRPPVPGHLMAGHVVHGHVVRHGGRVDDVSLHRGRGRDTSECRNERQQQHRHQRQAGHARSFAAVAGGDLQHDEDGASIRDGRHDTRSMSAHERRRARRRDLRTVRAATCIHDMRFRHERRVGTMSMNRTFVSRRRPCVRRSGRYRQGVAASVSARRLCALFRRAWTRRVPGVARGAHRHGHRESRRLRLPPDAPWPSRARAGDRGLWQNRRRFHDPDPPMPVPARSVRFASTSARSGR